MHFSVPDFSHGRQVIDSPGLLPHSYGGAARRGPEKWMPVFRKDHAQAKR
jgi:hypothetical protein